MRSREALDRLDRHALVLAIWLPAGFLALAVLAHGFRSAGPIWVLAGFVPILFGFAAHLVVNAVLGTDFTEREAALGLTVVVAAIVALFAASLFDPGFAERYFLPSAGGLAGLAAAIVGYLVIRHGPRRAFETFDIIRDNNPRRASRLPHRGGHR
jgi:predicted anti-sigma-YlaC factor YlaD